MLHVCSGRISSRDPDRLDITRKSAGPDGLPFAPSRAILAPALKQRRSDPLSIESFWPRYREAYLAEMRESYRLHRPAWEALLARPRVVLVCYCVDPKHCHRSILRSEILPALGACDCGEWPALVRDPPDPCK